MIDLISTATSKDEADRNAPVALLSMGSFEQQGDYLPLATDTIIASIVTRELTDNDRVRSQSKLDRPRSMVIAVPTGPQPPSRAFGRDVALWPGEQFIADHELAHGGGAQQRRVVMAVQMPFRVLRTGGGRGWKPIE